MTPKDGRGPAGRPPAGPTVTQPTDPAAKRGYGRGDSSADPRQDGQLDLFDATGKARAEKDTDEWWRSCALQAVRAMAATGCTFQCYDLVETYGVPEPDSPSRWGPLLARAAREGLIVPVGAAPSRRPATAGSLCRTWRGAP